MSTYTIATGLINEINLSRLLQKQRSITRLSPQFYNRVAAVSGKGGIRFTGQKGDTWFFDVHSGTKDGVWWHAKIKFLNLVPVIQDKVRNRKLWNKDRSGVDYRKLAQAVLYAVDIQLECDCLVGSTVIPLLDGRSLSIEEIYKEYGENGEFWIYSANEQGDFEPGRARCSGVMGETNTIVKVTLDNGKIVECTMSHLFMMRNGEFKPAFELKSGDSLMPMYSDFKKPNRSYSKEYMRVKDNSTGEFHFVHRRVAERVSLSEYREAHDRLIVKGKENFLSVHHKDFNAKNNSPDNLKWMGQFEHMAFHAALVKKWGREHPDELLQRNSQGGTACLKKHPEQSVNKLCVEGGRAVHQKYPGKNELMWKERKEEIREKMKKSYTVEMRKAMGERRRKWWIEHPERKKDLSLRALNNIRMINERKLSAVNNHKVVGVEIIEGLPQKIYDLNVLGGYPVFALDAGVFVHNCPADKFWAHQYTRSRLQYNAMVPPKELRAPTRNNKKEYGIIDKHLQALVNQLPMYEGTFAKFLKMKYANVVQAAEGSAQKELAAFQGAAAGLKAREEANVED